MEPGIKREYKIGLRMCAGSIVIIFSTPWKRSKNGVQDTERVHDFLLNMWLKSEQWILGAPICSERTK